MAILTATLDDGGLIRYDSEVIGEGGMKRVHFTPDKKSVVCFFKDASVAADPQRRARLQKIVGEFNPTTDASVGDYWRGLFCWPTAIVTQPETGVVAPTYASNFFFSDGQFKGKEKQAKWFTSAKLRRYLPQSELGDWLKYIHISTRLARAVRRMHSAGVAHSDLSNKNVLIDPKSGAAVIIDCDSLVVPQIYPPDVLGTPGYIAPEVLATQKLELTDPARNLPGITTDRYALAVLIYEYLLGRHPLKGKRVNSTVSSEEDDWLSMGSRALWIEDPHDNSNPPFEPLAVSYQDLGPYLAPLCERAFGEGLHHPGARPDAGEWERALVRTTDVLHPCTNPNCPQKWFVLNFEKRCPWCQTTLNGPIPMLNFYREGSKGQFKSENHRLVVWHHQRLWKWHIHTNQYAGERADRSPQGYFARQGPDWWLINQNDDAMVVVAGADVPNKPLGKNQGVILRDGMQIHLSRAGFGRLAIVQMV